MPIDATWDPEKQIWTLTVGETFDLAEIAELVERTDWHEARRYLWVLDALRRGPDSTGELHDAVALVANTREKWAGSRTAILVARDLDFGIARMFGVFAEQIDVEYRAFRDRQAALKWLEDPENA